MARAKRAAGQFAHEAFDALVAAGEAAGIDEILPDGHGVAAPREPHLDGVAMHRTGAGRRRRRRGSVARPVLRQSRWSPLGRFCADRTVGYRNRQH